MRVDVNAFNYHKAGNLPDEYEDAFYLGCEAGTVLRPIRLAVADGATTASFAGAWAKILADAYGRLGEKTLDELRPLQELWQKEIGDKPLPWYAEEKLQLGAFATLAGLEIRETTEERGCWTYLAVGDSCIFQVRDGILLESFPIKRSADFDNSPFLISSRIGGNTQLGQIAKHPDLEWSRGDVFYLMTDALACFFLSHWEEAGNLGLFDDIDTNEQFAERVIFFRDHGCAAIPSLLKNDDVTLVRCRL